MEMEPVQGYAFANWEKGYGDVHLVPDLSTLRIASWLEKSALVLCDVRDERTHGYVRVAPRSLLRDQIDAARDLGFAAFAASELEYYVFEQDYRAAAQAGYASLTPTGWYLEDYHILQGTRTEPFTSSVRRHLKSSGIPIENSKGEWGLDRAGSSCHVHLSLWRDGQNAFAGDTAFGPVKCSDTFRWFLGGWIARVPDVMVFYAPTVNSYKRYVDASWAPTRLAWSYDNRTAGFRVVGQGASLRIECRIPGADCNPYLAFAAALASGLDGIRNRTEAPDCFSGDMYAARHLPPVATSLRDAREAFVASGFVRRSFGDEVVDHYAHFFKAEYAAYSSAVTDWERRRYFERI
jgi:glutamine synthetase